MMRRPEPRRGDRPRRPRLPRRGSVGRGGAVAGASDRLRGRARKRLERLFASPRLSGRLAGRPDRRRRRAARDFAGARRRSIATPEAGSRSSASTAPSTTFAARAETFGIALFAQKGSYTTGELGYYPRRLAEAGLVALAATSGPALMTVAGAKTPVYCTNPIAFAAPLDEGPPLIIDQASSATAFVELRRYAERGEALPPGWAVDADGQPTTDPQAALRGALLAFGGARGANIALMVEVLAAGIIGRELGPRRAFVHVRRSLARRGPHGHCHRAHSARAGLSAASQTPARAACEPRRAYSRAASGRGRNRVARRARGRDRARRGALKGLAANG